MRALGVRLGMPVQAACSPPSLRLDAHGVLSYNVICKSVSTENTLCSQSHPRRTRHEEQRNNAQSFASPGTSNCNAGVERAELHASRILLGLLNPFNPTALLLVVLLVWALEGAVHGTMNS